MTQLTCTLLPPFYQQDSWDWTQCLSVALSLCFHQLLHRVSLWQLGYSPICWYWKASSGTLSSIARSLIWSYPCGLLGVSLALGFSLAVKCPPPQRRLFLYSPYCPQSSYTAYPISSLKFPSLHPFFTPSSPRRTLLFTLPTEIRAFLFGPSLLCSLRGALTPVRMVKIKNTDDSLCWRECGVSETLFHFRWECRN